MNMQQINRNSLIRGVCRQNVLDWGVASGRGLPQEKIFLHQVVQGGRECQNKLNLKKMLLVT